jgi:hypothetical protein
MKRRIFIILLVLLIALSTAGCVCNGFGFGTVRGSRNVAEEERQVSQVTAVELDTFGDLYIEQGDRESLRIEAEDNLLPYLTTEVHNGTLIIGQRQNVRIVSRKPVKFYLTVEELDAIELNGSGNIKAADLEAGRFSIVIDGSGDLAMSELDADALSVDINGSGNIEIEDLYADAIDVEIDGSGTLEISNGEVEQQDITIDGSGDYRARDIESNEARIRINGSGSATVYVRDSLTVTIRGSGDIHYAGDPAVDTTVSGSGDVRHIGD